MTWNSNVIAKKNTSHGSHHARKHHKWSHLPTVLPSFTRSSHSHRHSSQLLLPRTSGFYNYICFKERNREGFFKQALTTLILTWRTQIQNREKIKLKDADLLDFGTGQWRTLLATHSLFYLFFYFLLKKIQNYSYFDLHYYGIFCFFISFLF